MSSNDGPNDWLKFWSENQKSLFQAWVEGKPPPFAFRGEPPPAGDPMKQADQMSDLGFLPEVTELLDQVPAGGQRMLFSATMENEISTLVKRYLSNPVTHEVDSAQGNVTTMSHHILIVKPKDKAPVTAAIASRKGRTIIFVRTQLGADRIAEQLRDAGVTVAIDDFGTGHSSLQLLSQLPVDVLKIDRSFIQDLPANRRHRLVVQMTISLAKSLGMKTVAEGVESEAQVDVLQELGCDVIQGYLVMRPSPAHEIGVWIESSANARPARRRRSLV